jgi:hypothetical protein
MSQECSYLAHDSHENLTGISIASDMSNRSSRRNSIAINDHRQVEPIQRTYLFT